MTILIHEKKNTKFYRKAKMSGFKTNYTMISQTGFTLLDNKVMCQLLRNKKKGVESQWLFLLVWIVFGYIGMDSIWIIRQNQP